MTTYIIKLSFDKKMLDFFYPMMMKKNEHTKDDHVQKCTPTKTTDFFVYDNKNERYMMMSLCCWWWQYLTVYNQTTTVADVHKQ